ncbi:MAG: ATP-binding cassette domain-containing protein [Pseudomonadota bacterium]|nr:ATP-binding cassette domain-containing protein [Pseudomonadota bacterium]
MARNKNLKGNQRVMSEKKLFEAHRVDLYRGTKRVFKNLNLTINNNESLAIFGPNGSGKTTLLKAINREIYPASKNDSWIKIFEKKVWNVWQLRSMIGIVSDDLHLSYNPNTIGMEVILSGFYSSVGVQGILQDQITKEQIEKTQNIMHDLDITDFAKKPLHKISMGQKKRCLLARALVHNPQTILLDEPTTGLDLAGTFKYLEILTKLKNEGCNIILISHNLLEITEIIDRVILLSNGKIVADGNKTAVLSEENLSLAFSIKIGLKKINGNYLPFKKTKSQ